MPIRKVPKELGAWSLLERFGIDLFWALDRLLVNVKLSRALLAIIDSNLKWLCSWSHVQMGL
jgi:hypothetical protein